MLSSPPVKCFKDGRFEMHRTKDPVSGNPELLPAPSRPALAAKPVEWQAKRLTDLCLAISTLILLLPLFIVIAILIKIDSSGPIIFKQRRIGQNGKSFEIFKFRTMNVGTPDLPTDQMLKLPSQITRVGAFLRTSSLDELPQIFNVLKNDMSFVGPRPALYNQLSLTDMRKKHGVLDMLPGITGWAQVNGRDELPDQVKVEYDSWYCKNWNYFLDWKILIMTIAAVVTKHGAK